MLVILFFILNPEWHIVHRSGNKFALQVHRNRSVSRKIVNTPQYNGCLLILYTPHLFWFNIGEIVCIVYIM